MQMQTETMLNFHLTPLRIQNEYYQAKTTNDRKIGGNGIVIQCW
jgi:hypothetical protein